MRATALVLVAATLAACSDLKKPDSAAPQDRTYGSGIVHEVAKVRIKNDENRTGRIIMGVLGGPVGIALAAGTEGTLGTSEIWEYVIRDSVNTEARIRSYSVMRPGDCVRFVRDWPQVDTPIERLTPDQCGSRK